MRIIQTVNDTIRLLFNPKTEVFRLSDFLLVRDSDENFLAQVIEVYDDKFDQEANVAKIKLIYRIVNGNEIAPFDNYTPSRECEVAKIKQGEIEKCINLNKKTITIGKSFFSKEKTEINTHFFDNNCVIFADKFEQTNQIFENLAPRLSSYRNILILDFSGTCKLDNAASFEALNNFKLPLSSDTIDYIQQKTLIRAKLETQVVLGDVFEEVKKFLLSAEENYIPFQRFIKTIQTQCKQTPSVELLVLISWLKKYAREELFAKNKREFESFFKSLGKNKITTLDLSNVKTEWQKEYLEYIINRIKEDVFVLIRLNDNNINNDIINTIYLKKKNITFIPSFAYGYKKASYIMEFAQNYILMPTLNPKRDFAHANFQIQSLNKESYMIFGEDTKDFIFTLENESPVKKSDKDDDSKDKMFISLNLQLEDMTPLELRPNNFEIKPVETRKKRLQEEIKLSDVLGVKDEEDKTEPETAAQEEIKEENPVSDEINKSEEIEIKENIETISSDEETNEIKEEETEKPVENGENEMPENAFGEDELDYFEQLEGFEEIEETDETPQDNKEEVIEAEIIEEKEEKETEEQISKEETKEIIPEEKVEIVQITPKEESDKNELEEFAKIQEEEIEEEANFEENTAEPEENTEIDDEILDAIDEENAKDKEEITETKDAVSTIIDEVVKEKIEDKIKSEETNKILDEMNKDKEEKAKEVLIEKAKLEAAEKAKEEAEAKKSEEDELDKKFDEIMNETKVDKKESETLKINEKVSIDLNKIKKEIKTPENKLPIFNEEDEPQTEIPSTGFKEGDKVSHDKYGEGEILKVIKYGARCLLQIEFPEVGKRLLDPKIAKLKTTDEI